MHPVVQHKKRNESSWSKGSFSILKYYKFTAGPGAVMDVSRTYVSRLAAVYFASVISSSALIRDNLNFKQSTATQ